MLHGYALSCNKGIGSPSNSLINKDQMLYSNVRRLLDGSDNPDFRRRVLRALGNAALEEDAEWILMHRERPLEHSGL